MLILGSDWTASSWHAKESFFHQGGFTANALCRSLQHLVAIDNGDGMTVPPEHIRSLHSKGYLPFIDLYQWCSKKDQDRLAACDLTRRYLDSARPLIVLALGQQVLQLCSYLMI